MDNNKQLSSAARLSDAELRRRVVLLAGREREATVELIGHLAELAARKLYLADGYGSLFAYCTQELRLAEHAAYNRIEAAQLARRFPVILDLLAEGVLNLSTVRLLTPHLRADNFESLVAEAQGRSKREVEKLVARLDPRPDVAASVRKLPVPPVTQPTCLTVESPVATCLPSASAAESLSVQSTPVEQAAPERPKHRPVIAPLTPERYRFQFTVGAATHETLRRAQELLRREIPDGDPGEIFDWALTLLLEEVARRKLAIVSKPRETERTGNSTRHIPAHVKRAVWIRDGGRCAFRGADGRRCTQQTFLEFHHREPYAIGGAATVTNISLRCRAHNLYEAELAFGPWDRTAAAHAHHPTRPGAS